MPVPIDIASQRSIYKQPQFAVPYSYWKQYGSGGAGPREMYGGTYGEAVSSAWAYGNERYAKPSRVDRFTNEYNGTRKDALATTKGMRLDAAQKTNRTLWRPISALPLLVWYSSVRRVAVLAIETPSQLTSLTRM